MLLFYIMDYSVSKGSIPFFMQQDPIKKEKKKPAPKTKDLFVIKKQQKK